MNYWYLSGILDTICNYLCLLSLESRMVADLPSLLGVSKTCFLEKERDMRIPEANLV